MGTDGVPALRALVPELDWSTDAIVRRRNRYYSASQRAFVPYKTPLILKTGKGQYVWDECGKRYLDLLAMNLCISVGHAHSRVTEAVIEQTKMLSHCTTMFYHPVPAHFAEELAATMPSGDEWVVHFMNSGAEAADLALLMARSYTRRIDFLALRNSYHGATFGAQSMTGISSFRHDVPLLPGIHHVANPDQYRGIHGPTLEPYLREIDDVIGTETSGRLAGIIIEPIQGYGGIVPMPPGYLKGAFERVRAAGGVCISDEVQAGFARTGTHFWSFEGYEVVPDIVVTAKGIGNGFPLAAVIAKREIAEALADKFYFIRTARTLSRAPRAGWCCESSPRNASKTMQGSWVSRCLSAAVAAQSARHHRRCARPRLDAGNRAGEGSAHEGACDAGNGPRIRPLARVRHHHEQVRCTPQRPAHSSAVVPAGG